MKIDVAYTPEFEQVYLAYPRHVGKAAAARSYAKAIRSGVDHAVILQAVRAFAASPAGRAGIYTPHPATWLNNRRWEDDQREWSRGQQKTRPGEYGEGGFCVPVS